MGLVETGEERIAWAARRMPVLAQIRGRWERERPLDGLRVGACLHVTTETANLVLTLQAGGAEVALCASNPLSTQDDVAAALAGRGIAVHARRGESREEYYDHIRQVLDTRPQITMDDGADLVATIHQERPDLLAEVWGGTEETTTGVIRLKALAAAGRLHYPIVAVNDARTKYLFDNRYGTGQSALDGILRSTNILLAGSTVVVVGYGWCGRGVAARARGMGAQVVVVEVDPLRALEAAMEGFAVMPMDEAAPRGDLFITVTGNLNAIGGDHMRRMKDGAILANAGHFNVEIDIGALEAMGRRRRARENVDEYTLPDGRRLYLLAEGRLVNLAGAEGHPAEVMDMSFADQALTVAWLATRPGLSPGVYPVPAEIDEQVARMKLAAMGITLQELSEEQKRYLQQWEAGTV
ncbi:MAG: adenosylhomocysteinase [Bacillota bacterium]|nr:adenosylhomocysteinase [Bacillota bacterium]MDI7248781.1 adenosylhomocysteinase [Bacillota bacterium]